MTKKLTELEPNCARSISQAWKQLGEPDNYSDAVALLLDCGGDDAFWMRLVGSTATHRRVGALTITAEELIYVEGYSAHDRPRSTLGFAKVLAQGKDRAFGDYVLRVGADEVIAVEYEPAVYSEHGAMAVLTITVGDEPWRFAIRAARPGVPWIVAAAYGLVGEADPAARGRPGRLREDGIYLAAANTTDHRFEAFLVEGDGAYPLTIHNPRFNLDQIRSGDWKPPKDTLTETGDHFLLHDADGNESWTVWTLGENRIAKQRASWRGQSESTGLPDPFCELVFVGDEHLKPGWGMSQGRYYTPDWGVQIDGDGELVAPELGHIPEGSTVAGEYLQRWALSAFNTAVNEAKNGKEFRRKAWAAGVEEVRYSKLPKQSGEQIRSAQQGWPTESAVEKRIMLALIYSVEHDGESWVHCDAYCAESRASLTIEQPYRKRMMSFSTTGEIVIGGPAEPFGPAAG